MRLQLAFFLFFSLAASASDEKAIRDLFTKYEAIMDHHKVELIDEVFSKRFINGSGGKKILIKNIMSLPKTNNKSKPDLSWNKDNKRSILLVKYKEASNNKTKNQPGEFILIKENGALKIDGTLSDGE